MIYENKKLKEEYKLIAKFMGYTYWPYSLIGSIQNRYYPGWFRCPNEGTHENVNSNMGALTHRNPNFICRNTKQLNFSKNIKNLMSVVDKIESTPSKRFGGFVVKIEGSTCTIYTTNKTKEDSFSLSVMMKDKYESIYRSCVNFIEKYNEMNNDKL